MLDKFRSISCTLPQFMIILVLVSRLGLSRSAHFRNRNNLLYLCYIVLLTQYINSFILQAVKGIAQKGYVANED